MVSDQYCGSNLFVALPEDALTVVNQFLSPKDVCNSGSCCRTLHGLASSDEIWIAHCKKIGILYSKKRRKRKGKWNSPHEDVIEWRKGFASYKALYRFLASVHPLLGIWVHQNPELGNVVYVMPGFLSVVGCRIIPQELGPSGMEGSPILWAPVFEIIGDFDGSAAFFLHGREGDDGFLYPGSYKAADRKSNVLLLEAEARQQSNVVKLVRSKSFDHQNRLARKHAPSVPFSQLAFDDRGKLIETVTCQIRLKLPDSASELLFPHLRSDGKNFQHDIALLCERRSLLMNLYKEQQGGDYKRYISSRFCHSLNYDDGWVHCPQRKGIFGRLKQLVGRSSSTSRGEKEHAEFHKFLRSADAIGLSLRASTVKLPYYNGWPRMYNSHFVLHKLPVRAPRIGKKYAGLWEGTYGWPPGRPGEALFFVSLSYQDYGRRLLVATKILEGTNYAHHPNGSIMFKADTEDVSGQAFPWDEDVVVLDAFPGRGIVRTGNGFRFPVLEPGSLFVIERGLLAFVWEESEVIFTLKRLDLTAVLKKGKQVPALSPVLNFTYLSKSFKNVYLNTST